MAEARSSFDRSQLKTNDNIHGRSHSVSYLGSRATRRNISCSGGNDGPIYMLSSNLACHSAGLSVHDLFTDIGTGFICRPSGHIETCLLAQVFPCAISILNFCNSNMINKKSQKHHPWSGRGHWTSGDTLGKGFFLVFCFDFPYQTAAECVLRLVHCECALRVGR